MSEETKKITLHTAESPKRKELPRKSSRDLQSPSTDQGRSVSKSPEATESFERLKKIVSRPGRVPAHNQISGKQNACKLGLVTSS